VPRARNIKPGFFRNEELVELDFEQRLLFIGLWTLADREGRLEDRPKRIKMELFPADDVNVDAGLQAMHELGLVIRYQAKGKRCIWIPKFAKHQNPHHREPASDLPPFDPGPEKADAEQALEEPEASPGQAQGAPEESRADSGFLNPDSCSPNRGASKPRRFVAARIDLPPEVDPATWQEWCEFRSAKRKPVSETAARKQLKMLCRYPMPVQRQIVEHSIANDYQGLFEPKEATHAKPKQTAAERQRAALARLEPGAPDAPTVDRDDGDVWPSLDQLHGRRA
jgi:hypothetical protein